jgi:hypothetical protein
MNLRFKMIVEGSFRIIKKITLYLVMKSDSKPNLINVLFDFRKLLQPAVKLLLKKDMLIIRGIKQAGALPQTPLHFLS